MVDAVLAANAGEVARYHEGKTSLLGWFMGQVMKETRGTANPDLVRKLLMGASKAKYEHYVRPVTQYFAKSILA